MSEQLYAKTNVTEERQKQLGLWAAGIFTALSAAFAGISIYAVVVDQHGLFQLEDAVLVPATIVATVISLLSYFLIRRGRYQMGIELLFITMMTLPVTAILLIDNFELIVASYIAIFAPIMFTWVLPKATKRRAVIIIALVLLVTIGIEMWNPGFRGTSTVAVSAIPIVTALAVVVLLAYIVRQAWERINYSITHRLTALVVGVTVPLLIVVTAYISNRAGNVIEAQALQVLQENNQSFATNVSTWLELNTHALQGMTLLPDIISMRANEQRPVLQALAKSHPYMYLISTTDLSGLNIARNDDADLTNYSDREWFQNARSGVPITYQSLIGRSTGQPALVVSAPILNANGNMVGIGMFAADLTDLSEQTRVRTIGETGYVYVVDANNMVLAHPDPAYTTDELQDLSEYPPVAAMRQSQTGLITFTDESGVRWRAYVSILDNGWGIVAQQPELELLASVRRFQIIAIILILIGSAVMAALAWFAIRRNFQPLGSLTTTVSAIAAGDLSLVAEVKSQDEIGILASTFNGMTVRLRESFATLEQRVVARTRNLQLAAEVGRSVSQVRALDIMLKDACELILKEFNLYYVQVYLTDPSQTSLRLEAGTGSVGEQLFERGHSLPLNVNSINGRAAVEKRSVVISDTSQSATFRQNPLLPGTRGEMAVPLVVADKVVGVLDMQSREASVLTQEILPAFEALAGQLAVAIQNANLLAEAEQARAQVEAQARRLVRQGWNEHLDAIHMPEQLGFVFNQNKITPLADMDDMQLPAAGDSVSAPISVAGATLGSLVVEVNDDSQREQTMELVSVVARQVAQQVENLRILNSAERYRLEAEEASRRLTREGWKSYTERTNGSIGYVYDLNEVRPQLSDDQMVETAGYTLPLKVREETIGRLIVQGLEDADEEALSLASTVAERLSAHIESLRQFDESKHSQLELDKRAKQLAAVAEVSTVSTALLDPTQVLQSVVDLTKERFDLYHAHIYLLNEAGDTLKLTAGAGDIGRQMVAEGWKIPLNHEDSIVARAVRTRQSVISNDIVHDKESEFLSNRLLPDTRSEMAVPLMVGDYILGVFDVQSDRINAFTEEDANIQTTLASQVATSLQNARSFAQAQKQAERESRLNVISQKIQSATTVEAVLQIAARELGHTLGAPLTIAQLGLKETSNGN